MQKQGSSRPTISAGLDPMFPTNQYENIWGWGGGTCICAQHMQAFFCHHCISNTVCNDYLPSFHIMLCISSNLELPKVFRRLCVSHMSTAEERFEHLRILVSKMDLRTNPPHTHQTQRDNYICLTER